MKILMLNDRIPPENRGGAGEVFWRLAKALHAANHDVHVIAATDKASFDENRDGIPTYHIHSHYPERFRAWYSLYNPQVNERLKILYQQIKPDVVNGHNVHEHLGYHAFTLANQQGIPVVFSSHDVMPFAYHKMAYFINPAICGVPSPNAYRVPPLYNLKQMRLRYNPIRNWRIRHVLAKHTQRRTAPSQELATAHHANDLPEFMPVHNGIDVVDWQVSSDVVDSLRERLTLQGRKIILFAGRLTQAKGTIQLLDALKIVVQDVPTATLLVLSPVPIDEQITDNKYADLRDNHIVSGGWLQGDELVAAYHLADIVAVPSVVFDTFPTVNLEAMATATPVLASCYGGSREAVLDGETGYIVNPYDTGDLAHKITNLLTDDDLRQRMGVSGQQRVTSQFSIQTYRDNMLAAYREAIDAYGAS